jgi:hypothetical protein
MFDIVFVDLRGRVEEAAKCMLAGFQSQILVPGGSRTKKQNKALFRVSTDDDDCDPRAHQKQLLFTYLYIVSAV